MRLVSTRYARRAAIVSVALVGAVVATAVTVTVARDTAVVEKVTEVVDEAASAVSEEDGRIEQDSLPLTEVDHPAIRGLDPALLDAVSKAAVLARRDGVQIMLTSGWRSEAYQQELLDEAVREYGSLSEALRWVQTPERSAHTKGDAVDVAPPRAYRWLRANGDRLGLCQVYRNEDWHFELVVPPGDSCPPPLPDGTATPDRSAG
jgi:uncharacterized protein YcbK (DUF882 family)